MCVERSSMVYWHWSRHSMNGRGLRERTGVWRSGSRGVLIQRRSGGRGHRRSNILIQSLQGGDNCRGGKGSGSSHRSDLTDGSRVSRGGVRRPVFMLWMDGSENDGVVEGIVRVTDII